jgi:hypothetical protein
MWTPFLAFLTRRPKAERRFKNTEAAEHRRKLLA